jgi:hypothetical protein
MNPSWVNNYGASLWLGPAQSSKKQHWLSHPEHIRLSCLGSSSSIPCCCEYRAVGRHLSSLQQVELQVCRDVFFTSLCHHPRSSGGLVQYRGIKIENDPLSWQSNIFSTL